jgi:hypothetical protein
MDKLIWHVCRVYIKVGDKKLKALSLGYYRQIQMPTNMASENNDSAQKITDKDLLVNQYDMYTLEHNVDNLDFKLLLRTQILSAEFCVAYILNDEYASCVEDTYYFTDDKVLSKQKHLTQKDLDEARKKYKV